jgi:hypothetical protein
MRGLNRTIRKKEGVLKDPTDQVIFRGIIIDALGPSELDS